MQISTRKTSVTPILAACAVCLLGWLMIVYHLRFESMWLDEWFSWHFSQMGPFEMTRSTAQDVHPPTYYLLLWLWTSITGSQDLLVMRLTAAFPALLAVAVSYRLGKDWFRSTWAGLAAALFLATGGIFIYYARELRMYTLVVLLAAASWWYLWRWLRCGGRAEKIGYVVTVSLMLYTYYFSGFIVLAQLIFVALLYRRHLLSLFRLLMIAAITFLPWLVVIPGQIYLEQLRSGRTELIGKYGATAPTTVENIGIFVNTYSAYQPGFVLLLALLGLFLTFQSPTLLLFRRWITAAAIWFLGTISLFFILNLWFPIYNLRYVLPIIGGLALLVGATVHRLPGNLTRAGVMALAAVIGIASHANAFLPPKAPHREMLQIIAAGYLPGDRIWYNLDAGALGSHIREAGIYHLQFDAPRLSTDWFVWNAPNEFLDTQTTHRVWDVRPYWVTIPPIAEPELVENRVISEEYPIQGYTVQLYEAAPQDKASVTAGFENQTLFEWLASPSDRRVYHAGDTVTTKTWWRVREQPPVDYSYTLILRRAGEADTLLQSDGGLLNLDGQPTSQWVVQQDYSLVMPQFQLPGDLPPGEYEIWMGIYYWENPTRMPLHSDGDAGMPIDTNSLARIAAVWVEK